MFAIPVTLVQITGLVAVLKSPRQFTTFPPTSYAGAFTVPPTLIVSIAVIILAAVSGVSFTSTVILWVTLSITGSLIYLWVTYPRVTFLRIISYAVASDSISTVPTVAVSPSAVNFFTSANIVFVKTGVVTTSQSPTVFWENNVSSQFNCDASSVSLPILKLPEPSFFTYKALIIVASSAASLGAAVLVIVITLPDIFSLSPVLSNLNLTS